VPFRLGCGKVETDTISKTMTFQPLKQERFTCMQLTKTETRTAKSSLYSISSDVRAESLTNDFEVNDLFTSPGITIFTTKFSGFVPDFTVLLVCISGVGRGKKLVEFQGFLFVDSDVIKSSSFFQTFVAQNIELDLGWGLGSVRLVSSRRIRQPKNPSTGG